MKYDTYKIYFLAKMAVTIVWQKGIEHGFQHDFHKKISKFVTSSGEIHLEESKIESEVKFLKFSLKKSNELKKKCI